MSHEQEFPVGRHVMVTSRMGLYFDGAFFAQGTVLKISTHGWGNKSELAIEMLTDGSQVPTGGDTNEVKTEFIDDFPNAVIFGKLALVESPRSDERH